MKKSSISLLIALGLFTVGCSNKEKQDVKDLQNEVTKLQQQINENILIDDEYCTVELLGQYHEDGVVDPTTNEPRIGMIGFTINVTNKHTEAITIGFNQKETTVNGVDAGPLVLIEKAVIIEPNQTKEINCAWNYDSYFPEDYPAFPNGLDSLKNLKVAFIIANGYNCLDEYATHNVEIFTGNKAEKIETPEPTDTIPVEAKPADDNVKPYCEWCDSIGDHESDDHIAQCYYCPTELPVKDMAEYNGRSFHCGCRDIKDKTCIVCNQGKNHVEGKEAEDGWACFNCIDKVNEGKIIECCGCAKFYDPSKINYDESDNAYCTKCAPAYTNACENCNGTNGVHYYQLTLAEDGINMSIKLCNNCWNDQLAYRKQHAFCWSCGGEKASKDSICRSCFPVSHGTCGYCNVTGEVFDNLDGWNVPVCESCLKGMDN